ncbi:MAG: methylmalonyl Co-A mutase-associated GTPase MeaB [Ignavibacteriae bacterium]|nr:methylmalonyl Co-A mutase-associated GTPase MeaB [Ignavibacteriota bacterium]
MSDKEKKYYKPDWHPENAGDEYAVRVVKANSSSNYEPQKYKSKEPTVEDLVEGVLSNNRTMVAKTITLIESNSEKHHQKANEILARLIDHSGNSIRIGITGVPGAGKSTLIEALGLYLIEKGHKVAVLAVDPSSTITKGSILGDKTRMEKLSKEENAFIRPSPSSGTLGGVTRKTRETITVCEAAGFDVILIETVGVGQSEVTVRSMVDFFMLINIAGAGDELQGIKKGVIELSDALIINKADGDNETRANIAKADFTNALHYLKPATKGWQTKAFTCSAISGKGINELWKVISKFVQLTKTNGVFEERRKDQLIEWTFSMIENELKRKFYDDNEVKNMIPEFKSEILKGNLLPTKAAEELLKLYFREK